MDSGDCHFPGCTSSTRANLDASATIASGTCTHIFQGCTNPNALNYNVAFNAADGSCRFVGCTDSASPAYNSEAVLHVDCTGEIARLELIGCRHCALYDEPPEC